jgi:23S rRNA maturation mini-RNase III
MGSIGIGESVSKVSVSEVSVQKYRSRYRKYRKFSVSKVSVKIESIGIATWLGGAADSRFRRWQQYSRSSAAHVNEKQERRSVGIDSCLVILFGARLEYE